VKIIKTILEKEGDDPEKKTSCFGGFCSGLRVNKSASISTKSLEI